MINAQNPPTPNALPQAPLRRDALLAQIDAVYAELAADIARTGVVCWIKGQCCDFESAEHVLFATTAEVQRAAEFMAQSPVHPTPDSARSNLLCPFWQDRRCTARDVRPLGCRVYFCDPAYDKQHGPEIYERYHAKLKALIESAGQNYGYVPFVKALRAMCQESAADTRRTTPGSL